MVTEHSYKEYDIELEAVRAQVLKMGGLVEENILSAVEALKKDDIDLAKQVIKIDDAVNTLEMEIDEAASRIIAKRQPAAGDLRMIIMITLLAKSTSSFLRDSTARRIFSSTKPPIFKTCDLTASNSMSYSL